MPNPSPMAIATGGHDQVPSNWMSATGGHAIVSQDPALVWLKYHGANHGFQPDESPYEFLDYVTDKGLQFEDAWVKHMAPQAVTVCEEGHQVRSADKVRKTFELMQQQTPVIIQGALWWAPARIYGIPDVLVHTSWLKNNLPHLLSTDPDLPGHYVAFDLKFTSKLDHPQKAGDLKSYATQVRIYSYMLGHLQSLMPQQGYLVTRDRIDNPLPIQISSVLDQPLDTDLAALRDRFVEIKLNGDQYLPWQDPIVVSNINHQDDQWHTAKKTIAWSKTPGRDPGVLYQIGPKAKRELAKRGFPSLDSMLAESPRSIPLEGCNGLGSIRANQIRTILEANRLNSQILSLDTLVPRRKEYELYVDYEFFSNINVDFETQWPALQGCEMIFMIGVGWEKEGNWSFRAFSAQAENHAQEQELIQEFVKFLRERTDGAFLDREQTAIYHWTKAEVWQSNTAAERHEFPGSHPLCRLPWCDLQEEFLKGPIGLPGAWSFKLKSIANALGKMLPQYDPEWPGELDQGLRAMVMGWRAYEQERPRDSQEMALLTQYLEADCKALWQILRWMRSWD